MRLKLFAREALRYQSDDFYVKCFLKNGKERMMCGANMDYCF